MSCNLTFNEVDYWLQIFQAIHFSSSIPLSMDSFMRISCATFLSIFSILIITKSQIDKIPYWNIVKPFPDIKFRHNTDYRELFLKAPTTEDAFAPERASHFELLKEFQAAQNTTCRLLFANTFTFIECLCFFRTAIFYDSHN